MAWQQNIKLIIDNIFDRMRQKSDDEQKTVFAFMSSNSNFRSSAIKFLMARKFNVERSLVLALFHAHKHDPTFVTHRTTLQGVVYQLDVAMEDPATQRAGIVFIYNMSGTDLTI